MGNAGTIVGQPHPEGGEKFLLDTGQIIETEGKEVVIPQELLESKKIYSFRGTNKKILGRILQLVGTSLKSEVTDIRYGDVIICMRSAEDKTVRILSGTIEEILDQVNQSNGCKPIIQPIGSRQLAVGNEQPMMAKNGMRIPFRQKLKDWQIENPNSPRWQKKKERIRELSNTIHRLRLNVSKDLQSDDEKLFLTTLVIAIMDKTAERIGNDDSADNGHFGVTGFQKKHVDIIGKRIHFNYTGKTGMKQDKDFSDERIAKALKRAIKNSPSKFIFETSDGFRIKADKANRYLEQFKITAKDIRGYLANKWMIAKLEVGNRQSAVGNEQPEKAKKERKLGL